MTKYIEGVVELTLAPGARHAEISAATGYEYEPTEITREEARAAAYALLEYADSHDPGPGAPYPLRPTAEELYEAGLIDAMDLAVAQYEQRTWLSTYMSNMWAQAFDREFTKTTPASEAPATFRRRK
jgi:hypothetical protein